MDYKIKRWCNVCGKVHTGRCKAVYSGERNSEADKFRNTQLWKRTAKFILERDFHCCRVCLENGLLVNRGLSVHHIIPLAEDFDLRVEETNLITLCRHCHERAERGLISRERLRELAEIPPLSSRNGSASGLTSDSPRCK
ncbi:MAG: HNH endonuclease [[Eubacterium] saphenum]|nr:HNH endonuclease [[Eubacterium] saphenum]